MPHGLMVVNAFLHSAKFDEIYEILLHSARECGMKLSLRTNAELCTVVDSAEFASEQYDFVLFWDKDVALATQLEQRGLPVFNSAQSILRCDDKSLTYLTLKNAGLPMPRTILAPKTYPAIGYPDTTFVDEAAARLGFPLVLKECFGSFGQQVYLMNDLESLRAKVAALAGTPMLFQELIGEATAAMCGSTWLVTVWLQASCAAVPTAIFAATLHWVEAWRIIRLRRKKPNWLCVRYVSWG